MILHQLTDTLPTHHAQLVKIYRYLPIHVETQAGMDSDTSLSRSSALPIASATPAPRNPPDHEGTTTTISPGNRAWPPLDDQELVGYKCDLKSFSSQKTIGQRMHRTEESCRAWW